MNALTDTWPMVTNHTSKVLLPASLAMDFSVLKKGHMISDQLLNYHRFQPCILKLFQFWLILTYQAEN